MARLRAVKDGEIAEAPSKPLTVAQAAASGDRKTLLVATRDRIATTVSSPDCPPRDLAALSRQLVLLSKDIEAIELAEKAEVGRGGTVGDESFDAAAL